MKRLTRISADGMKAFGCVCIMLIYFAFASSFAQAQEAQFTQGTGGSHAMTLEVPLTNYPGRGISLPVNLTYSSSGLWRVGFTNTVSLPQNVRRSVTEAIYAEHSTAGWTTSLDVPKVEWPRQLDIYWYTGKPYTFGTVPPFTFRIAELFMHLPDGSVHEMRKTDAVYQDNGVIDMTGTFYSVDGTRMRYDSSGQTTGTLYLANGSRWVLSSSAVQYIDRNGNTLNYDVANRQWTDTMGRVISMPWPANPGPGDYTYSLPAFNNTTTTYTLKFRSLSSALTPDAQGQTPALKMVADYYLPNPSLPPSGSTGSNFPQTNAGSTLFTSGYADPDETINSYVYMIGRGQSGGSLFNPTVLTEIDIPNGQSYKFSYNIYGELDKVFYPTGGYQRYQYGNVSSPSALSIPYGQGSRGITSRTLSVNGTGSDEAQWQYSTSNWPMTITAPDGTRTETYLFLASEASNNFGYKDAREGSVVEERVYAAVAQGGAMLRRTLYDYAQTSTTLNKPVPPNTFNTGTYTAYRNPRTTKTVNLILDTGGDALAKTVIHDYAPNGYEFTTGLDRTATTETNFAAVTQTSAQNDPIGSMTQGTTATKVETVYLNNAAYQNRNILALPTSVSLRGLIGGILQTVSRVETSYDDFALLTYGDLTAPGYSDPGTTTRGNVTISKRYSDVGLGLYLETHAQFDQCGNVRSNTNERGAVLELEYSSSYKHAFATQTTAPAPDPSGTHGSASTFVSANAFDFTTGLATTNTDVNLQSTTFSYQDDQGNYDPLNRLRKVTRPDGSWTKTTFNDVVGDLFVLTETSQDATHSSKSYDYVDPMGRGSRSFTSESATSYIARDTIYDQMGRASKVSNPYRTSTRNGVADVSHTSDWITTTYEPLGRVATVTLPDSSVVQTAYQGVYTTITDQAGTQRRQKTDALGRIVRVDEPNLSGSLGTVDAPAQPTSFEYDTQSHVVHVIQGTSPVQHRYFKYDGLGRLTYEHQIEQAAIFTASDPVTGHSNWSRKLVYDETIASVPYPGLLTSAYDARNIQTQFRYDNLNRVYQVSFTDGTPTVTNNYDQPRATYFNKGRLTEALTAAVGSIPATGQLYNFDVMGRVKNNQQTVGSESYSITYTFNLGGALTSETYPSGRVVNYAFDDGARLSQVSSGSTTYNSQFDYSSPSGLLKSVTLGNGAVDSYVYNSRMQVQSRDLTKSGNQLQHYNYTYGAYDPVSNTIDSTKNNGQIAQIEGVINSSSQWQQRFAYDTLGRLSSAREFRGDNGQRSYLVNYEYDVFGNRFQKQAQNGGNPFPQVWVEAGAFDQATNRFNSGVTYDNAGNMTVDSRFRNLQFQYDANNRQRQSANLDGSGAVVSVLDAGGQRVAMQAGGALTNVLVYDAMGKLIAEYNSTTNPGGTQYVFNDHQGSPRATTNVSGGVISRHDYLPFGEELGSVGMRTPAQGYGASDAARQKYAGMEADATGLAHTLWRQYDSLSSRWTSPDPYGGSMSATSPQSFNRYSYVNNDPVNLVDPTGLMLSDIGVYQTQNPEVARKIERAEDQGVKNWVAQQQAQKQPKPDKGPVVTSAPVPKPGIRKHEEVTVKIYADPDVYEADAHTPEKNEDPTCANCPGFNTAMHKIAVPMAKTLQTAAEIDVAIVMFPLGLEGAAAGAGAEAAGAGAEAAEIGAEAAGAGAEVAEAEEGFDFAVGLSEHLDGFAQETQSVTYTQITGDGYFVPENFESIANAARNIRINTQGVNWAQFNEWVATNPEAWNNGVTNWEMHQIMTNPSWFAKSLWYIR